jgi:Uma2 family endonuclease
MSTTRQKTRPAATNNGTVPELYNGDHLTQAEFHRRYMAMPEDVKAELIGGIVYMASPVHRRHGTYQPYLSLVLTHYAGNTPGVEVADNMTAILDEQGEPQPDLMLRVLTELGGQSEYNAKECLVGAPELVAEVAHSSVAIDMTRKKDDYLRSGVQEYIVFCIEEEKLFWFHFPSRRELRANDHGVWKSKVFPGLWLDAPALIRRDTIALTNTIQQGIASPEHATFVRKLQRRK